MVILVIDVLYTIGYSGYKIENFLEEIKKHGISTIIDVRSNPYSQYYVDYNKEVLNDFLTKNRIYYRNYAKEFGAQQKNPAYYSTRGYLDFNKFVQSDDFLNGVEKLKNGMLKGYHFALMCAEKDPIDCHRTIMITREFSKLGYKIIHLLPTGDEQSQDDIELRLLNHYFPNRDQVNLFEDQLLSRHELITLAYEKKNAEIGYTLGRE